MCCGLGLLGQGFTAKNPGQGRGRYGRRFEETGNIQIANIRPNADNKKGGLLCLEKNTY
jgi:hypothetical protein